MTMNLSQRSVKKKKPVEVAMYKGDDFICGGTIKECAAFRGVKPDTIRYYLSQAYANKVAKRNSKNPIQVVRVEDDEDEDE